MKPIKVMIMGEPGIIEVPVALQSGERTRMDARAGLHRHGRLSKGGLES
ncbi:MAG: hypothetical protein V4607_11720 [Pseudomonadota bacterium]